MFSETARYYDKLYAAKDYQAEVEKLTAIICRFLGPEKNRLLDIGCGTGQHIRYLRQHFQVEGLDVSADMVRIARQGQPDILFHQADMIDFKLGKKYDIITSLFSSIGYVKTLPRLYQALACMEHHLAPGGVLIIEPWFTPASWIPGTVHGMYIDEPDLKISRINTSGQEGQLSFFDLHYLIGTPTKTEHFVERHELGLFETETVQAALEQVGLRVSYDPEGLTGRGLFIGFKKPARE
ncbi:methyltransferase domain-containing protein [candidate division CSSED10-310 bacterium]|uniref:Methyltransferase domain-containing protein n=1 Tax=candidate division CSSED10-310 bacterium TaxID=2855610 RepID=A0ABV6YZS5_UNCC1